MTLPEPMEARLVAALPDGPGWVFEPKWDGFRAIAARRDGKVELLSKSGKSLLRFFPEIEDILSRLPGPDFVLDGELILPVGDRLSFDALQKRLHPAASRIAKLARETPAQLMVFDCLSLDGTDLSRRPLKERRAALETFVGTAAHPSLLLSPSTTDLDLAQAWLDRGGGALDGIMAKPWEEPYRPGERAMLKIKQARTADCVVGGFRRTKSGDGVASLLLGLYNADGKLDHVGFCSSFAAETKRELLPMLEALIAPPGFTGKTPGGPSRWRADAAPWEPLRPELVAEVGYDQITGSRFRHGTSFLRWRPDKSPRQCDFLQLAPPLRPAELDTIFPIRVAKAGMQGTH